MFADYPLAADLVNLLRACSLGLSFQRAELQHSLGFLCKCANIKRAKVTLIYFPDYPLGFRFS